MSITMSAATVGVTDSNSDSLIDTPTNYEPDSGNNGGNYCTLSPLKNSQTLSNGNLDVVEEVVGKDQSALSGCIAVSIIGSTQSLQVTNI